MYSVLILNDRFEASKNPAVHRKLSKQALRRGDTPLHARPVAPPFLMLYLPLERERLAARRQLKQTVHEPRAVRRGVPVCLYVFVFSVSCVLLLFTAGCYMRARCVREVQGYRAPPARWPLCCLSRLWMSFVTPTYVRVGATLDCRMYTNWRPRGAARVRLVVFARFTPLRFLAAGRLRVRLLAGARGMLCVCKRGVYTSTCFPRVSCFCTMIPQRNKRDATHRQVPDFQLQHAHHARAAPARARAAQPQRTEPERARAATCCSGYPVPAAPLAAAAGPGGSEWRRGAVHAAAARPIRRRGRGLCAGSSRKP